MLGKLTLAFLLATTSVSATEATEPDSAIVQGLKPGKYANQLSQLEMILIDKGYPEVILAFQDPRFEIYENLEKHRKKSLLHQVDKGEMTYDTFAEKYGLDSLIKLGTKFYIENEEELTLAESKYGIPAPYITAIVGIENGFKGKSNSGSFYIFNTLSTKWVLSTKRKEFWLANMVEYLEFIRYFDKTNNDERLYTITPPFRTPIVTENCWEDNTLAYQQALNQSLKEQIFEHKGSYGVAMGLAQFIPASLPLFVDSKGDYRDIDIYSLDDNIHSISNYLDKHGWEGNPTDLKSDAAHTIFVYCGRSWNYVRLANRIADSVAKNVRAIKKLKEK